MDDPVDDPHIDDRLSRYGEPPTEADIDPAHPKAPRSRPRLRWRLMTAAEILRLAKP